MAYNFKECNRDQVYLLPPTLQEWLPAKDLVWLVLDAGWRRWTLRHSIGSTARTEKAKPPFSRQ